MEKFSEFVKEFRLSRGLTQKQLAARMGVNYVSIIKAESGKKVGLKIMNAIAAYSGVDTQEIRRMMKNEGN